ncbi:hypothetical protein THAOC_32498, partial [Thalassiosira oceanica]
TAAPRRRDPRGRRRRAWGTPAATTACRSAPGCVAINLAENLDDDDSLEGPCRDGWMDAALALSSSIDGVSDMIRTSAASYGSSADVLRVCLDDPDGGSSDGGEPAMSGADRSLLETTAASMAPQIEQLRRTIPADPPGGAAETGPSAHRPGSPRASSAGSRSRSSSECRAAVPEGRVQLVVGGGCGRRGAESAGRVRPPRPLQLGRGGREEASAAPRSVGGGVARPRQGQGGEGGGGAGLPRAVAGPDDERAAVRIGPDGPAGSGTESHPAAGPDPTTAFPRPEQRGDGGGAFCPVPGTVRGRRSRPHRPPPARVGRAPRHLPARRPRLRPQGRVEHVRDHPAALALHGPHRRAGRGRGGDPRPGREEQGERRQGSGSAGRRGDEGGEEQASHGHVHCGERCAAAVLQLDHSVKLRCVWGLEVSVLKNRPTKSKTPTMTSRTSLSTRHQLRVFRWDVDPSLEVAGFDIRNQLANSIKAQVEMCLQVEDNQEKGPSKFSGAIDAATADRAMRWKEATDSEGNTYYYHDGTKEVRWDKPLFYREDPSKRGNSTVEEQASFAVTFQEADEQVITVDRTAEEEEDVVRDVVNPTVSAMFSR